MSRYKVAMQACTGIAGSCFVFWPSWITSCNLALPVLDLNPSSASQWLGRPKGFAQSSESLAYKMRVTVYSSWDWAQYWVVGFSHFHLCPGNQGPLNCKFQQDGVFNRAGGADGGPPASAFVVGTNPGGFLLVGRESRQFESRRRWK